MKVDKKMGINRHPNVIYPPDNTPSRLNAFYDVSSRLSSEMQSLKNLSKKGIRPERWGQCPGLKAL